MPLPTVSDLANHADLRRWLIESRWEQTFDPGSLRRSSSYVHTGAIRSITIRSDTPRVTSIQASVRGTSPVPYDVEILLCPENPAPGDPPTLRTECSCPVHAKCKHAAAVLRRLKHIATSVPDPGPLFAADQRAPVSAEARNWIRNLESAAHTGATPAGKSTTEFLAYCIEPGHSYHEEDDHRLALRVATQRKDGRIVMKDSEARADPVNPPRYMQKEDVPLAALYYRLREKYDIGDGVLKGAGWSDLIQGALTLGRLYFGVPSDGMGSRSSYDLLASAPPVTAQFSWEQLSDGGVRPVVQLPDPAWRLVPIEPPHYLDPEGLRIGVVESALPPGLFSTWARGPVVSPDQIPALADLLAVVPTASPLPVPVDLPVKRLTGLQPTPHLLIRHARLGRFSPFDTILGEVSFRYGDSPKLFPLTRNATPRSSWLADDSRVVLERDAKTEKALRKSLQQHGLIPLLDFFNQNDLDEETLHGVTLAPPFKSLEVAWLLFLEDRVEGLRSSGWKVEVAPDSGLVTHDIDEFIPAIEVDSEHGIDWFRFDLTGECDGRQFNLIPYIALALEQGLLDLDPAELPEHFIVPSVDPEQAHLRFPTARFLDVCRNVAHLFHGRDPDDGPLRLDRLAAAGVAETLEIDDTETTRSLATLARRLQDLTSLPAVRPPAGLNADLRPYQLEGYRWLRFLRDHDLNGILADDMGLGKTVQALALLASKKRTRKHKPSLVIAPTSVLGNWVAEAAHFTPKLSVLLLHGSQRSAQFDRIGEADLVVTSYPLLVRDHEVLCAQEWHTVILDEAQYIKNPKTTAAKRACELACAHRLCLSGTPMENHLGELWSLMRFLMPGFLGAEKSFGSTFRRPIERDHDASAQGALNRRVAPLILRRTKDEVAADLPPKTELIHTIQLGRKETDLYESVRATMDQRVREAMAARGLAKSHIIVLDALLKLRQICCHPSLLKTPAAREIREGSKLDFLIQRLLPELLEEGRRILLFSQFTSVLALIEAELEKTATPYLKLTGNTRNRAALVEKFQEGHTPLFLISLKAGGTGLNLTAADTVIHYDPWWNPAVEAQATDRAHRIGQDQPVFVHKLICEGTIEDRIRELQKRKASLVKALLAEDTTRLKIDSETLSHLLAPID